MTSAANDDWDQRDRAARLELKVDVRDFNTKDRRGKINKAGEVAIARAGDKVGWVSVYEVSGADWLLETFKIYVFEDYRFSKDLHKRGEYQAHGACS